MDKIKSEDERQQPDSARKRYNAPKIEESGRYEHLVLDCQLDIASGMCLGGFGPSSAL